MWYRQGVCTVLGVEEQLDTQEIVLTRIIIDEYCIALYICSVKILQFYKSDF